MLLKDLHFSVEKYQTNNLGSLYLHIKAVSEMTYDESCFLNGLVRYFKPKKILEIGVAAGASTSVLLNAINDNTQAVIHSVDWSEKYYRDPAQISGWKAKELFPDTTQWKLHLGVDVSEIIDEQIGEGIDFLLLDTTHVHPAETLSFLASLPYLNENAIVVLHDVNLFFARKSQSYATKLLLDCVVADKITLSIFEDGYIHPNIAAFQINEDTNKYVIDVVRSLFFPWGIEEPLRILNAMEVIFKEKYPNNLHDLYLKSIIQNKDMQNRKPTLRERFLRIRVELRAICVACIPSPMRKLIKKLFFTE